MVGFKIICKDRAIEQHQVLNIQEQHITESFSLGLACPSGFSYSIAQWLLLTCYLCSPALWPFHGPPRSGPTIRTARCPFPVFATTSLSGRCQQNLLGCRGASSSIEDPGFGSSDRPLEDEHEGDHEVRKFLPATPQALKVVVTSHAQSYLYGKLRRLSTIEFAKFVVHGCPREIPEECHQSMCCLLTP